MNAEYDDVTQELASGDELPPHSAATTARKIIAYGPVHDAADNTRLEAGLHRNEVAVLMQGQRILEHAYRYAIIDRHIYHTRELVVIRVSTEEVDE